MGMKKIIVNICSRERPCELALLLESLREQTFQDFDVYLFEDNPEGKSFMEFYFVNYLVARMKLEGHKVFYERAQFSHGVSRARQHVADKSIEKGYEYMLRVDDDVILDHEYIDRLMILTDKFDIVSGVTPPFPPSFVRDADNLEIANEVVLDKEGNFLIDYDDCGSLYIGEKIIPAHHFRSCALIKKSVHEKVKYWPTKLSKHGFREETMFSFKALMEGFRIGVDLQAKAFHLNCPSGGERFSDQQQLILFNQKILKEWVKENKEGLLKIFPSREVSQTELNRDNNLARI